MKNVRISVVTVTLNAANVIGDTIASLEKLKDSEWEWIVIDGKSQDHTLQLVQSAKVLVSKKIISEVDGGIYDAMNKGVALASGDFVLFLNAGDSLANESVLTESSPLLMHGINVFPVLVQYQDGLSRSLVPDPKRPLWKGMPYSHQGMIYSRDVLKKHPFSPQERIVGDFAQLVESRQAGVALHFHSKVLACYRSGGISDSKRMLTVSHMENIVRKNHLAPRFHVGCYYGYHRMRSKFVCMVREYLPHLYSKLHR